ncbi:polyprenyl synthetase family protein [Marinilactibacillus piezotolerans]|uniref:polyprenyl synthetase family protein n=1 Tax=Marinilactibacillus piezotolerans TaxID=258723 RepID=UPI0009B15508|nr:farnesyl diphosphate synthase [Marinilactibacillus piezotolerans]
MKFQEFYQKELTPFETYSLNLIDSVSNTVIEEAMQYSLEAGGKRLRPLLLLAVLKAFDQTVEAGYPAAAALEYIHTYSLIHDDLPAMDDDDLRRGKPTSHIRFSESTAILAGDALLTKAFELITRGEIVPEKKVYLIKELAYCAGYEGMIGGQQADIDGENAQLDLEDLEAIHARKTGELLRFAMLAGGVIADADEVSIDYLEETARKIGIAYQIRDDILDVIGDSEELGKAIGADSKLGKSTYPSLLGLENAQNRLQQELDSAKENVQKVHQSNQMFDAEILLTFIDSLALE